MTVNVTLRQLRVFQAVAESGNFSRTGLAIGLTQPAVSRSIVELEGQLGLKLLDRTTREVSLTEAGRLLAARLDRVLEELDQALADVHDIGVSRRGKVRVASSPTISANLMPACIAACNASEPEIEFVLLDRIQQDVLDSVRAGEVDFGVVVEPPSVDDLHCEALLDDPFCLVAPPGHRLAAPRSVKWTALDGEPLVLLDQASGSRRLIDAALALHGASCEVRQEVGHPTTVFRMVEAGIGISVMPMLSITPGGLPGLVVKPLVPKQQRAIMLVHRRHRAPGPLAARVWGLIRETVRSLRRVPPSIEGDARPRG